MGKSERDVRILRREGLHRLAPEDAGFKHIGLVDQRDLFAPQLRGLEGDMGHPLDLARFIDHRVDGPFAELEGEGVLGLAEVEAAGQLAHDEDVEAAGNPLALDRRGVEQWPG